MFRLETPITCARPASEFDDISTILTHSSLTGSKKAAPWQQYVGKDGNVFYVELTQAKNTQIISSSRTDGSSVCALCSTRSCHSGTSEDTGYSSDTDGISSQKSEQCLLDVSHEPIVKHSKFFDPEDDDGVSVDLLDFERSDHTSVNVQHQYDDELGGQLSHKCAGQHKSCSTYHKPLGCTRTASLCERHSNKLSVPRNNCPRIECAAEHKACKCRGQLYSMSQSVGKLQHVHKEVILRLRPTGNSQDSQSKILWMESMLGIIPGRMDNNSLQRHDDIGHDKVVIQGLAPDGPAAKSKELMIGDHIDSINGRQISWNNLDIVLSSLHQTRKVRLGIGHPSSLPLQTSYVKDRLLLDTGSVLIALQDSLSVPSTPRRGRRRRDGLEGVCVVYMSMEGVGSEDEGEKDDVVYQFPKEDSVLSRLRGCFFTLHHLLTADGMDSDVRMLTVGVDGSLINVACRSEGKDMLIVTAPANRLQAGQLLKLSDGIVRLTQLLFGSANQAFSSEQHHSSLDDFFSFMFTTLLYGFKGEHPRIQAQLLGYMDSLPLPDDVVVSISNTLTEFESADFADLSDSFYGCRRAFTVLGSMAFYKGRVTCCHLPAKDAGDIALYLHHSGLLDLSSRHSMHQLLVWREVFPTRLCHEVVGINSVFGYSEPHARWFLMVVGVKNSLLACILEAGGCSSQFKGVCLPDPFYVDQARAALLHLQTPDIISPCEIRLCGDGLPTTTTADKVISHPTASESSHKVLDNFLKTTSSLANNHFTSEVPALSNVSMVSSGSGLGSKGPWKEWRKSSIESDGSSGSGNSIEGNFKNNVKRGRLFPLSVQNTAAYKPGIVLDSDVNSCKVTSGKQNALLVFCQVNEQEGVIVTSPLERKSAVGMNSLHQQVVNNFRRCVMQMHADFTSAVNTKVYPNEGILEDFHGNDIWKSCREEGVMFTCTLGDRTDSKKLPHNLVYWVIGRKLQNLHSREVYVCFEESTPQNVIDLAFRLSLGSLPST